MSKFKSAAGDDKSGAAAAQLIHARIRNWAGSLLRLLAGTYCGGLALFLGLRLLTDGSWWFLALLNTFALYLFLPLLLVVPLCGVLRMRRLGWAAAALSVIGLAWFGGGAVRAMPAAPEPVPLPQSGSALKIVVYNVRDGGRNIAPDVAWLLGTDADVIFLSELNDVGVDVRLDALRRAYPYEVRGDVDQRILSRHALRADESVVMDASPWRGVAIRTGIELAGRQLSLYSVHTAIPRGTKDHFDMGRFPFNFLPQRNFLISVVARYDETQRNWEVEQLLSVVRADSNPVIVAGDFNTSPYSTMYARVAALLQDTQAEAGSGLGHTWPNGAVVGAPQWLPALLRIDYIWHSAEFVALSHQVAGPLGSDHLPVMAVLAWK